MINITSVRKNKDTVKVSWTNSFSNISSLSIVFDDEGSCTTVGLDTSDTTFSTNKVSRYRTYDIYLKALTEDGWVNSEYYTYRLD